MCRHQWSRAGACLLLLGTARLIAQSAQPDPSAPKAVATYCSSCHNGRMRSPSGILLDQFDTTQISTNPEVWARAYRQLQAGTMPPYGAPRPDRTTNDAV